MATGTPDLNTPPPVPAADPQFEAVVDRQLRETRLHVKLTDIASTVMIWLVGLIVFLLTAAVVDSYVFDLGVAGRVIALFLLVAASLWYLVVTLLPMVVGRLNPVYVASIIEESQPSLKNSLMNFLLLRGDPRGVHNAIFSALRRQAATAVSQVNVSAAVDRSKVIRTGYVLAAAVAIFAIYTVLQPNPLAPLETMRRIFAPLAAIDRPTRVQITNIQPGDASITRGENVTVSAIVHHLGEHQQVKLLYTTVDNVIVDREAEMTLDEKSGEHRVLLDQPQQTFTYRIEAGDAVSASHALTVIDRPAIWVQSLDYNYPPQAGLKNRVEAPPSNGGDIAGIEGTHVTIHAAANMDIATAYLEFEPTADRPTRKMPMQHEGRTAFVKLPLKMNAKRDGPMCSGYRVRFSTLEGERNETSGSPHKIEVTPDMPPEVEVLHPVDNPYKLRANDAVEIEVRAVDVDFGLRQIILQAELIQRAGAKLDPAADTRAARGGLLNKVILEHTTGAAGKLIATHRFDARTLRLQAGDVVNYRAVAVDNRTAPVNRTPAPNRVATETFQIQISAPTKSGKGDADSAASDTNPGDTKPKSAGETARTESGSDDGEPGDETEEPSESEKPEDGEAGDESSESTDGESAGDESSGGESADGESSDSRSSDGKSSDSESDGGSDGESEGEQEGTESSAGGAGSGTQQADDSSSDADKQSGGTGGDSEAGDAADPSSEGSADGAQDGGGNPTGKPADGSSGGKPGKGTPGDEASQAPADDQQEPLHDGEVFERALEHLKKQQKQNGGAAGQKESTGAPDADGQPQNEPLDGGSANPGDTTKPDGKSTGQDASQKPQPADGSKPSTAEDGQPDGAGQQPQDAAGQKPQNAGEKNEGGNKSDAGSSETPQADAGKQPQDGGADSKGSGDKKGGMDPKDGKGSPQGEGGKPGKKDGSDDSGSKSGSDSQSASQSQKASSTKGDDGGDRSGAGKKGGGQGSDDPGQGKAGGSTPSDTGAGAANEPGKGETSDQAGGEKPGKANDGESGDGEGGDGESGSTQAGRGKPGQDAGDKQGKGEPAGDQQPAPQSPTQNPGDKQQQDKPAGAEDLPQDTPGGKPGESTPPSNPGAKPGKPGGADSPFGGSGGMADTPVGENAESGNMPPGDKANLEYARQATDLALEHLRKNSRKPDKELLDKLNMSPEELQAFVDRWQKMKSSTKAGGPTDRAELDDSLRSLGLTPSTRQARSAGARDDAVKGVRDAGSRSAPPASFLKKFKAFQKSVARGE